jgi:hypothetical protein
VYEWYLPYDSLKTILLPELEASCSSPVSQEILVAGCGNSTLCEDLWTSGELLNARVRPGDSFFHRLSIYLWFGLFCCGDPEHDNPSKRKAHEWHSLYPS